MATAAQARSIDVRLGRYELVRRLARSELTELWLARISGAADFQRHVVIKQIRDNRASDQPFVQSFIAEARIAGRLHHHNIVQLEDIGEDQGHYYLTMDYVHGESLRRVLARLHERKELMPLEHVLSIAGAVAAALHHAHEAGIVHRAVTPGNIIVDYDGNVKVLDFGIAKALGSKAAYMAPEACTGQLVDRRADVFALGVVLHEAVTGRRLFKGESDALTKSTITHGVVPRASQHRKDLPQALDALIAKAHARLTGERYQTTDELRLALEPIAAKYGPVMPSALASYMKQLFGTRAEPWHDTKELVVAPIDFDGNGNGLALPPEQTRAETDMPTAVRSMPIGEITQVDVKPPVHEPASKSAAQESTAIVAPLSIEGSIETPYKLGRRRKLMWLAASAIIACAAMIVVLAMTAGPTPPSAPIAQHAAEHAKPAPPKAPVQAEPAAIPWEKRTWANTEAAKAATPPAPEPKAEPAPAPEPAAVPEPEPEPVRVVEAPPAPKTAPTPAPRHRKSVVARTPKSKPATKPAAKPKSWDPNALFYGKKP